jgi:hypothetical protein
LLFIINVFLEQNFLYVCDIVDAKDALPHFLKTKNKPIMKKNTIKVLSALFVSLFLITSCGTNEPTGTEKALTAAVTAAEAAVTEAEAAVTEAEKAEAAAEAKEGDEAAKKELIAETKEATKETKLTLEAAKKELKAAEEKK